jgi:serine/threonine protein kinase
VFFSDENVRELQPERRGGNDGWRSHSRQIGVGAYGSVFKATWRGNEVAVKVLRLPEEPRSRDSDAKDALRGKLAEIVEDFTKEVEICCDLAHPNLVTLLGYATQPELLLMQELMEGNSLDQQLYNEKWKPTRAQILKVALDVASGMAYLHTAFQEQRLNAKKKTRSGRRHVIDKPVIHRDLKSPNLLLRYPPPRRGKEGDARDLVCKVSDFGLSRDKKIEEDSVAGTALMTGCGSVLWMAPEIMLGHKYNEKVDTYSYAMCLVELVHRNLPWHGLGIGQQAIPVRVTKGERPVVQLKKCQPELKQLIVECWSHEAYARPEFTEIMYKVNAMYVKETTQTRASRNEMSSRSGPPASSGVYPDRIDEE